jgi:hypothetical protein
MRKFMLSKIIDFLYDVIFGSRGTKNILDHSDAWRSFCEEKRGKIVHVYDKGRAYLTIKMTVPVGAYELEFRESDYKPLKVTCMAKSGSGINFEMWIADYSDRILSLFGGKDKLVGDKVIDNKYVFKTENRLDLQNLLQDYQVRERFTTCDIYALGAKSIEGSTVIDATLVPTVRQDETLREFYDLFSTLLSKMEEMGFIRAED